MALLIEFKIHVNSWLKKVNNIDSIRITFTVKYQYHRPLPGEFPGGDTVKSITDTFKKYPGIGILLPAMGYGDSQIKDLEKTINATKCDTVVIGTPIDLTKIININKPTVRVRYDLQEIGYPSIADVLNDLFVKPKKKKTKASKKR